MPADDQPMDRRRFFRAGLRGLLDKIGDAAGPVQRAMQEFERHAGPAAGTTPVPQSPVPRKGKPTAAPAEVDEAPHPPPAGGEGGGRLPTTCSTCQNCVTACPVQAIQYDPDRADGVPFIIAEEQPCAMCDGLLCMYNCPSGAIQAIPIGLIDMGTAEWRPGRCVRSQGTECTMCVDRCPIGNRAIELIDGQIVVYPDGCTGCGVCEHDCPTNPKSIVVIPAAART
jgi:ferredoxin